MRFNKNLLIAFLVIVILVLLGIIIYVFVIKPAINNYVINQGMEYTLAIIVDQIQQKGYVQIPIGNQTLVLVPAQQQAINSNTLASPDSG